MYFQFYKLNLGTNEFFNKNNVIKKISIKYLI
jgi:hypothetical protein